MSNKFFKSPYFYILTFLGSAAVIIATAVLLISNEPSNEVKPQSSVTSAAPLSSFSSETTAENPVAAVESSLQIPLSSSSSTPSVDASSSQVDERPKGIYGKLFDSKQSNPDTVGWLTIDGTKCDYAVMQSDDNDYYLERNENKKKSKSV